MTDVSSDTVTPTASGPVVARTLGLMAADTRNAAQFGLALDGVTDDSTNANAMVAALGSGATIDIPNNSKWYAPTFSDPTAKNFHWNALGFFSTPGGLPIYYFGDGDIFSTFYSNNYLFSKQLINSGNGYGVLTVACNNSNTSLSGQVDVLNVIGTTTAGCGGDMQVITATLNSGSTGNSANQESGVASIVNRKGMGLALCFYGNAIDSSGYDPGVTWNSGNTTAVAIAEFDLTMNGPDHTTAVYDQNSGARVGYVMSANTYNPPNWTASTAHTIPYTVQPSTTNGYVYVLTTAGTTGATEPTWPTTPGTTVTDGTAVWTCGTSMAAQVSRGIQIASHSSGTYGAMFGAGFTCSGKFYNACIDLTDASFALPNSLTSPNPAAAGLRMTANMPIDFSANKTLAGQNVRTLQYNSTAAALQYTQSGITSFAVADGGGLTSSGPVTPGAYAKASLPAVSGLSVGAMAFCTNGRNTGEGAGSGTGCPVFIKSVSGTLTWCAIWSGIAVTI